jgi:hypothetical protein
MAESGELSWEAKEVFEKSSRSTDCPALVFR